MFGPRFGRPPHGLPCAFVPAGAHRKKMALTNHTKTPLRSFAAGSRFMGFAPRFEPMQSRCLFDRISLLQTARTTRKAGCVPHHADDELGSGESSVIP